MSYVCTRKYFNDGRIEVEVRKTNNPPEYYEYDGVFFKELNWGDVYKDWFPTEAEALQYKEEALSENA